MTFKNITFAEEARKKIRAGVDKLANAVKSTLGPGGTNVILQRGNTQHITKDGVSVANDIWLEDPLEDIGAQLVKKAAQKTVMDAGDGTSTSVVLTQAIINEGSTYAEKGMKLIEIKRGIDRAVKIVAEELIKMSRPVEKGDIKKIALISANGDEEIGGLVAMAMEQVGLEGLVTVDIADSLQTTLKKVEGMQWDRGYLSAEFVNNPGRMECVFHNPVILMYDGPINSMREMMKEAKYNIIEKWKADSDLGGRPMLIICTDVGADAMSTFIFNKKNGSFPVCVVQPPDFGDTRKEVMKDIAAFTGATLISKEIGLNWEKAKVEHLGTCEKVHVNQWSTTITNGALNLAAQQRADQIREQLKDTNEYAAPVLKTRLARLINGLMVISVGGSTEIEIREKMDRIDDSLNATRAAIEEGVLPGGGVAFVRIHQKLSAKTGGWPWSKNSDDLGKQILMKAILQPTLTIAKNAGRDGDKVLAMIRKSGNKSLGFDAVKLEMVDMIESGIIDPAKVVRCALENAASVAGLLLTTDAVVSHAVEKK